MNKYHKIPTVFDRDPEKGYKLIFGQWSTPELKYLAELEWEWTEKIDGTSIRVRWEPEPQSVWFKGRTDTSEIPPFLLTKLEEMFPVELLAKHYAHQDLGMTLYGEGYGNKIQKVGKDYISDGVSFILFDVMVGGWWLRRKDVNDIAQVLGIKSVPVIGKGSLWEGIYYTQRGFTSHISKMAHAEGLVMRPTTELFTRGGDRIICKVKFKDFPNVGR